VVAEVVMDPMEWLRLLVSAMWAGVFALIVLVAGQGIIRFFFEPILELHKVLGEVQVATISYANVSGSYVDLEGIDTERERERVFDASKTYRDLAAQLYGRAYTIPRYSWAVRLGLLPPWSNIEIIKANLIGLSNDVMRTNPESFEGQARRRTAIEAALPLRSGSRTPEP
jgi:hypothetical protein